MLNKIYTIKRSYQTPIYLRSESSKCWSHGFHKSETGPGQGVRYRLESHEQ